MELRSNRTSLRRVWIAGQIFAGLLFLVRVAGHLLQVSSHAGPQVGFSRELLAEALVGYGIWTVAVLAFSRGLYYRSIVSGVLLLIVALEPIGRVVLELMVGPVEFELSVLALMNGALALSAMGLIVIVVRAIYELTRKKVSQERRLIS